MSWIDKLRRAVGFGPHTPPQTVIGTCVLCGKPALYRDGHDFLGQTEHFDCTKRAASDTVARIETTHAFARIRAQLKATPELERSLDNATVVSLTREFTVPNLLRLIAHIESRMATVKPVHLEPLIELTRLLNQHKRAFA